MAGCGQSGEEAGQEGEVGSEISPSTPATRSSTKKKSGEAPEKAGSTTSAPNPSPPSSASQAAETSAPPPLLTLASSQPIYAANVTSYDLSGTCSEEGEPVQVQFHILSEEALCEDHLWAIQSLDLSEWPDGEYSLSALHNEASISAQLVKDVIPPEVAITTASAVTLQNTSSYEASGSCNEEQSLITLTLESLATTTTCQGGSWHIEGFDTQGIGENPSALLSASIVDLSGNTGTDVSVFVVVDRSPPTLSITHAVPITTANEHSYQVVGTCTDSGSVDVTIGTIPVATSCVNGSWTTGYGDVSGLADGTWSILVSMADEHGNLSSTSTTIPKQTAVPSVAIHAPEAITSANVTAYSLSGDCTGNGEPVVIDLGGGAMSFQPLCGAGVWMINHVDVSSLPDDPALAITANHTVGGVAAPEASASVAKNIALPTVTFSLAEDIHAGNQSSYQTSGTCSESGVDVAVAIGSLLVQVPCSNGTWVSGLQDVSALADGPVLLTASHDTAIPSEVEITKATLTPTLEGAAVGSTLAHSLELSWNLVDPGGYTVSDYLIEYRVKGTTTWLSFQDGVSLLTHATIAPLNPSTYYEFRVAVVYDGESSPWSNIAEGETKPDNEIFDSPYKAMNVGGASTAAVVAFEDETHVTLNGEALITLNQGQRHVFSTAPFDIIDADKPIYTAGRRGSGSATSKGNITFSPTSWAGKSFSFNAIRNNAQKLAVYAIEDTSVEVYQGSTLLAQATLPAGGGATLSWSVYGSYQVVSSGTILAYHYSAGSGSLVVDPKPLLPSSTEIIGIPSRSMRITADLDQTNYNLWHSNSSTAAANLDRSDAITVSSLGTQSQFQEHSLLIKADRKISGASFADSNGNCASVFLPTSLMRTKYAINTNADWVAFASKSPGTIAVYSPGQTIGVDAPVATLTLTRSGSSPMAPYKARRATTSAGYRFVATVPVAGWYQPNNDTGSSDQDETILYGVD